MPNYSAGDWNMMGYGNFSWLEFAVAVTALFVIIIVTGLSAWLHYHNRHSSYSLDVLKLRLAKGEINRIEFKQLKNEIGDK